MRPFAAVLAVLLSLAAAVLPGQDAAALATRTQQLAARAAEGMHAAADAYAAQKLHGRAFALRTELWQEYAAGDAKARDKTGFVPVGQLWRRDEAKVVLEQDLKGGDAKAVKKTDAQWATLQKELLAEHRALAAGWQALGDAEQAAAQWRRVLRFAPGDKDAAAALALQPFEGFTGSPAELALFRRGRTLNLACDWLRRTPFATQPLAAPHPLLAAAKVAHAGVVTRHYRVWGNLAPEELATVAQDCERARLLAATLVGTWGGALSPPATHRDFVFVVEPAQYAAILDQCQDQFDAERLAFLKTAVSQAFVASATGKLLVSRANLGVVTCSDMAVRGVVRDVLGIRSEGLFEGIGHAACGFLFGRTLTFLVEQKKERTMSTWTQRALAPDLAVWAQIAEESAWSKSDTRMSELVLLKAANFTADQRVKSWAVCHYFAHWRPDLIQALDRVPGKDVRTPPDVEAAFRRDTQVELARTDAEWREFWTRGGALRKAMAADAVPGEKEKGRAEALRARALADAVNAARAATDIGPVGWFQAAGPDVQGVKAYDEQWRKAESERDKRRKAKAKDAEAVAFPSAPASIGRTVLFGREAAAEAAVAAWLADPTAREFLLHPGRELFGCSPYAGAWLLDVTQPSRPTVRGLPTRWPADRAVGVSAAVRAGDLGAPMPAALAGAGIGADAMVGTPITLHFWRALDAKATGEVACHAFAGNRPVDGVLVALGGERGGPDGCFAFVPKTPWPAGATIEVRWDLPAASFAKDETFPNATFTVR